MTSWIPSPEWRGQDAIIIGGGPSLEGFAFEKLSGRNVIGANDAFRLGPDIVQYCIFGDASWFTKNQELLVKFGRPVVCVAPAIAHLRMPWLHHMERERVGLHIDGKIGWNFSTGAAAVNLAVYLGAIRIFLLGFDMTGHAQTKRAHWHTYNEVKVAEYSYRRFISGFAAIERDLVKFKGTKILNVIKGQSKLPFFPRITHETFWKYVPPQQRVNGVCVECEERKRVAQERVAQAA